jgi:acyl-CoA-binding protein
VKLELTEDEVQTVVNALSARPYAEVHKLIFKVFQQINEGETTTARPGNGSDRPGVPVATVEDMPEA